MPSTHNFPSPVLVIKFGGTSVGDANAMNYATEIVREARLKYPSIIVVTSAMAGVTNLILESAKRAVANQVEFIHQAASELRVKHNSVVDELIEDPLSGSQLRQSLNHLIADYLNLCQAIAVLGESTPRALDAVSAIGERLSVRLLASVLESGGIPAKYVEATQLILTDHIHQAAHPDFNLTTDQSRRILYPHLAQGVVPVVTGFIGATPEGVTTTLGRGGSDYSAAILGAVIPADEVWIMTDVDGVMTADPRIVPNACTIPELSYKEISELAYFGAKVVHPKTIRPVIESGITLRVANTFNPTHPGTYLLAEDRERANGAIKAVTTIQGQRLITIEGRGMLGVPGVAARAFGAVAATGTSVPMITQASSEQSICFAVPSDSAEQVISALERVFAEELIRRDIDRVWGSEDVVIITVVGAGMRNTPGIAGKVFGALGDADVNVIAIAQGSSEVSISLVVDALDAKKGVQTIHDLII